MRRVQFKAPLAHRKYVVAPNSNEHEEDRETLRQRMANIAPPTSPIPAPEAPYLIRNAGLKDNIGQQAYSPTGHGIDEVPRPGVDNLARAIETINLETMGASQVPTGFMRPIAPAIRIGSAS